MLPAGAPNRAEAQGARCPHQRPPRSSEEQPGPAEGEPPIEQCWWAEALYCLPQTPLSSR
eukprot:3910106-Prorocentrum_lima.AAC.1